MLKKKILLNCDRNNILKCDHCVLNLVHQQLRQLDKNTSTFSQQQQILTGLKQVFDLLGVLIVTSEGEVKFMTQRGKQLLSQYFSNYVSNSLPEILQNWLKHQISLLTSQSQASYPCFPLHIEQVGKRLSVHLISDLISREQYLLLWEEQKLPSFSIASLELLGLTKREAEVLFWVAKDKNNVGIAKVLGCCEGTVRKHLEHIHRKLEVQTRTAAVIVALERLGLLEEHFVAISS
ncbi:MAG: LuxR C-terminal-related transcriptional regulator [Xenococcaceae cyanobacterium MO_167.B52]|nr:LuxR C-terminal-related transcriptional regulator [Xenococcaceae cyanobacterium MO_167.B52]